MPVYSLTLTQLRERCRRLADMEGSAFISDAELDALINARVRDYTHLVAELESEEHGLSVGLSSGVVAAADISSLDAYRILHVLRESVDGATAAEPIRMRRLDPSRRGQVKVNTDPVNLRIEYIATAATLVSGGDTWTFTGDAEDYLVGYVSAKMLAKEESDAAVQLTIAGDAERRLRATSRRTAYDGTDFPDDRWSSGLGWYWRLNANSLEIFRDSQRELYWP